MAQLRPNKFHRFTRVLQAEINFSVCIFLSTRSDSTNVFYNNLQGVINTWS